MFVSDHKPSETGYPGECPLDDPAFSVLFLDNLVLTLVMGPVLLVRGYERDPSSLQGRPQPVTVIGFVRNDPLRTTSCSSFSGLGNMDIVQRRLSQSNFGRRCRIEQTAQRDTRAVDDDQVESILQFADQLLREPQNQALHRSAQPASQLHGR